MSSSFQDAVSKLRSPVKELVSVVTEKGQKYAGETESDQKEVVSWIEKSSETVTEGILKDLDAVLLPKTYVATNYFTAADVALYGALYPVVSKLQPVQYYSTPSIARYFDHIQSQEPIRTAVAPFEPVFGVVQFDFDNAPAIQRKAEPPKKKEKKAAATPAQEAPPVVSGPPAPAASETGTPAPPAQEKTQKKEKKEKKKDVANEEGGKKNKGGKAAPVAEDAGEPVPSMVDLRVGHIVDVIKHPDADGLYIEQIDLGEETGPRTVVSGLVHYIPIEEMRDKYLVAVCNLKPANMRGVKSFAMVLAATSKDGKEAGIELIQPPPGSKPGERVYFEGAEFETATPLSQLNPKKKIFETVQPGFTTLESREAAWVNPATKSVHRIRTKDGVCVAPTLAGASLS
ncbi:nucleic acid-binding protein [Macrolepiota fuliginosa MF-IS2]|uniref:Nucleic acid-binding protein n=1 Tax=Macrolepiota fuliginosa MF-IS2 TaxID=1400762 RepID=A0A9P5XQB5_9AGAR|nr:nucleic acid-binding protein [Macrolepiota fuliginosa MF-IS2]